ncbi:MAG: hypothetical protein GX552_11785 [Chloroflexi bacterium]|nr:hypothetical protein [Chloroflexota bacterium]
MKTRFPVWLACSAIVILAALFLTQTFAGSTSAQTAAPASASASVNDWPDDYPPPTSTPTPKPTCPPPATPEPFWVEPVRPSTNLRYQTIKVYLGKGYSVIASSEAGTASVTGKFDAFSRPAYVTVPLEPNITNHIVITGVVEYWDDCFYTLTTSTDRYGNPLEIEQRDVPMSIPLITNKWTE